ncbi:hypothetical protein Q8F55_002130 [Vanrija albida]|uniref:F-box domain-containing protein n=1 Tax=Vanrija albida TaxID=181172 RepID=A0ABR3Q8W8_9TREE
MGDALGPTDPLASLQSLPDDALSHVFELLSDTDLVRLRRVSRTLNRRVLDLGIPLHLTHHAYPHTTLHPPPAAWPKPLLFAYNGRISRALAAHSLHAAQLGPTWPQRVMPALSVSPDRLLLGVGTKLLVHPLHAAEYAPRVVGAATEIPLVSKYAGSKADIVGVHELPGGAVAVAQFDGTLQRVSVGPGRSLKSTAHYPAPKDANIHVLSGYGQALLAGFGAEARLYAANSPWVPPATLALGAGTRPWSALVTQSHAFVGVSGAIRVCDNALRPQRELYGARRGHSAPYALVSGRTPHTLLAAWHDGAARLYDLRQATPHAALELRDPWSDAALYSAAFVGEASVAAGSSQHGQVSVWDVRRPDDGWSLFSPGGRGSPVYDLHGEGGRLWGVTERRAFVLSFDGAGEVADGIVLPAAKAPPPRGGAKDVPTGWRRRGGKMGWTVHYGQHAVHEVTMGYLHGERGMTLFETKMPMTMPVAT